MLKFIDFFAGIGGFRLGLEKAGMKCIGFCEKDKFAVKSYTAMYDTKGEWYANDITAVKAENIPKADLWCAGSPCQAVSIAGKRNGLHGGRSNLFFDFVNLLKGKKEKNKPEWIILENVKGLLSSNKGWDFLEYLCELDESGYDLQWQVFNSKDYGVPQNRERVYTVGHLRNRGRRKILPITGENGAALSQIIGGSQGYRVYDTNGVSVTLGSNGGGYGAKTRYNAGFVNRTAANSAVLEINKINVIGNHTLSGHSDGRIVSPIGISLTVMDNLDTVTSVTVNEKIKDKHNVRIRNLTPRECFRLQGFSDDLFEKARAVNSDSQLYKQAGNAVTVNVVYAIGKKIAEQEGH